MIKLLAAVLLTLSSGLAWAQTCTVSSVHDGDSMRVLCPGQKKTIPIRLDQIDTPELNQAHGTRSRDYLQSICPVGKPATIINHGLDQYKRTIGTVTCGGVNANAAMVKTGNAWVYDQYVRDRSLYQLQDVAKATRSGLWENRNAMAPWEFRRANQ